MMAREISVMLLNAISHAAAADGPRSRKRSQSPRPQRTSASQNFRKQRSTKVRALQFTTFGRVSGLHLIELPDARANQITAIVKVAAGAISTSDMKNVEGKMEKHDCSAGAQARLPAIPATSTSSTSSRRSR